MVALVSTLFGNTSPPFRDIAIRCQNRSSAVLASIDEIEDLFGDLVVHGDGGPIIGDPGLAGEYLHFQLPLHLLRLRRF